MEDMKKKALIIANVVKDSPPLIATESTGPGLYLKGESIPIAECINNSDLMAVPIFKALNENPSLEEDDFYIVSNRVVFLLHNARKILIERILEIKGNSIQEDKETVISNMGQALDIQMGRVQKTKSIFNNMRSLGVSNILIVKYNNIHDYYLATKHGNEPKFVSALTEIGDIKGKIITVEYYETVRKILYWYYKNKKYTVPSELNKIDYTTYGVNI